MQRSIREDRSPRHVNMTISLAFFAPSLVKAAVEGRLRRGCWSRSCREEMRLVGYPDDIPEIDVCKD
jgi:hypothetical protein